MPYGFNGDKTKRELYKSYARTISTNAMVFDENNEGEWEKDFTNEPQLLASPFLMINVMVSSTGQSERPNGTACNSIIPNLFYQEGWQNVTTWNYLNGIVLDDGTIIRVKVRFDLENTKLKVLCKLFNKNGGYITDVGIYGFSMIP